ncbi:MAG: phosphate-selective porin [Candidatus Paceibacteria bacterium]|jgi:phosphate-selective porin
MAARLMVHPFEKKGPDRIKNLAFGGAVTIGRQDRSVAGDQVYNAARLPIANFAPGTRLDGHQRRVGLEAVWFDGPDMLQAELMHLRQEMTASGGDSNIGTIGAYVSAQHVLSGEDISFAGVAPRKKARVDRGRGGA